MSSPQEFTDATPLDIAIVGAGMSGIGCAYRLQTQLPGTHFLILEGRGEIGGTWDLFKYPGVRSDVPIYTYAFPWHPWYSPRPFAEGPQIMEYVHDTVSRYSISQYIRLRHKVLSADWSSGKQWWVLRVAHEGQCRIFTARFLVLGTGYYDYESPLKVEIPGLDNFKGKIIHPQFWPEGFDYSGQKIAVIGSGATAVSLLPALVEDAAQVTMVQRSPSYILAYPNQHYWLRNHLPPSLFATWELLYNLVKLHLLVLFCHHLPRLAKATFRYDAVKRLPSRVEYDPHFKPRYNPWEQRMSMDPDGELYQAFHRPNTKIITGEIETVTSNGLRMKNGDAVNADIVVTATGLRLNWGAHMDMRIDGEPVSWKKRFIWNGAMIEGLPNMLFMLGYTNGSWTVGADDTALIMVRLLKFMRHNGLQTAVPHIPKGVAAKGTERMWQLSSTYVKEVEEEFPVYGKEGPWRLKKHPPLDWFHARWGDVTTGLDFLP